MRNGLRVNVLPLSPAWYSFVAPLRHFRLTKSKTFHLSTHIFTVSVHLIVWRWTLRNCHVRPTSREHTRIRWGSYSTDHRMAIGCTSRLLTVYLGLWRPETDWTFGNNCAICLRRTYHHSNVRFTAFNKKQAISFIVGFALQDIKLALFIGLGGSAFALVVVVPPWPLYNRHPTKWISDRGIHANTQSIIVDGKTVS